MENIAESMATLKRQNDTLQHKSSEAEDAAQLLQQAMEAQQPTVSNLAAKMLIALSSNVELSLSAIQN
eukprot:scaffold47568_cov16-Prasinocladus_malaysianus.AAC.3